MRKEKAIVTGAMEPRGTDAEMRQLFDEIDFLLDPFFSLTKEEENELREKIEKLKKFHRFN